MSAIQHHIVEQQGKDKSYLDIKSNYVEKSREIL